MNADNGLGWLKRQLWWGANWLNNNYRRDHAPGLLRQQFRPEIVESDLISDDPPKSPSRLLSDLFLDQFDWQGVRSELPEIRVFEAGCGRGSLAGRLNQLSGGCAHYFGIDKKGYSEWEDIRTSGLPAIFKILNSTEVSEYLDSNVNLIVTQSSLEHFEQDPGIFAQIRDHIEKTGTNTIQIHSFHRELV